MKHYLILGCFLIFLQLVHIQAIGVNLSFENNNCTQSVCSGSSELFNWTTTIGDVDLVNSSAFASSDGLWSIDMNGNDAGGISQVLTVAPFSTFTVSFYLSGNPTCDLGVKTLQVSATGNTPQTYTADTSSLTITNMNWAQHFYNFSTTSASSNLTFQSLSTGSACGPALDQIAITLIPSPSPTPSVSTSPSPSISASVTPSPSPVSPSSSPSRTPSPSVTPSPSPVSPSSSPSRTPSPSVSQSPGASPTSSPSVTPSNSPTASSSATPTASVSATASSSPSASSSFTPVPSFSFSYSYSPFPSAFPSSSTSGTDNTQNDSGSNFTEADKATIAAAILVPVGTVFLAVCFVTLKHGPFGACGRFIQGKVKASQGEDVEMQ